MNGHDEAGRERALDQWIFDARFLNDIAVEIRRAREKFPETEHMLAALTEEVGELANALIEKHHKRGKTDRDVWEEAIQVAAMALRVAVEGDPAFDYSPPDFRWPGVDP